MPAQGVEVRSKGPELDIQGEILPGWNVIATYANQDVRVTKSTGINGAGLGGQPPALRAAQYRQCLEHLRSPARGPEGFQDRRRRKLQDGVVNADNTL